MVGFKTIKKYQKLEIELNILGLVMCESRYGTMPGNDVIAIKPKDQTSVPVYARDTELFCGTLDDLERWIQGVKWARDYDRMIFGDSHDIKRERKEQDIRNKQLVKILKE